MEPTLIWGLSLLAVCLLLVVVEVFLPSGGIIAMVSAACGIGGLAMLYRHDTTWGLLGTLVMLVATPVVIGFAFRVFPDTAIGRRMIHGTASLEELQAREAAEAEERARRNALVGAEGEAFTDLHPSGVVVLGGKRHDAVTDGSFIDKGQRVRVVGVEFNEVKVRPA